MNTAVIDFPIVRSALAVGDRVVDRTDGRTGTIERFFEGRLNGPVQFAQILMDEGRGRRVIALIHLKRLTNDAEAAK